MKDGDGIKRFEAPLRSYDRAAPYRTPSAAPMSGPFGFGVLLATTWAFALSAGGCTDGTDTGSDRDAGSYTRPTPGQCEGALPLELGRCVDGTRGYECTGTDDEEALFDPMPPLGGTLSMVTGPQASTMFVIAVRTAGIHPGNPEQPLGRESPLVEIDLSDEDGQHLSLLRRRAAFTEDPGESGRFYNAGFFVVVDAGLCPHEQTLTAQAMLTDRDGEVRCGSLDFIADCGY